MDIAGVAIMLRIIIKRNRREFTMKQLKFINACMYMYE